MDGYLEPPRVLVRWYVVTQKEFETLVPEVILLLPPPISVVKLSVFRVFLSLCKNFAVVIVSKLFGKDCPC